MKSERIISIRSIPFRRHIYFARCGLLLFLAGAFLLFMALTSRAFSFVMLLPLIVLAPMYLPAFILHWQYYRANRNTELEINFSSKRFVIRQNGQKFPENFENIRSIETYVASKREGPSGMPWSPYYYTVLNLQSGRSFAFSCLFIDEDDIFKYFNPKMKKEFTTPKAFLPLIQNHHRF